MFCYLEAMVKETGLDFPQELLKGMYELYLDLTAIVLNVNPA